MVPEVVLGYTLLHFVFFALVGMGLTALVHLATKRARQLFGSFVIGKLRGIGRAAKA